jgi:hypothetical protein
MTINLFNIEIIPSLTNTGRKFNIYEGTFKYLINPVGFGTYPPMVCIVKFEPELEDQNFVKINFNHKKDNFSIYLLGRS